MDEVEFFDAEDTKFELPNQPSIVPAIYDVFGVMSSGAIEKINVKARSGDEAARVALAAKRGTWARIYQVGGCRATPEAIKAELDKENPPEAVPEPEAPVEVAPAPRRGRPPRSMDFAIDEGALTNSSDVPPAENVNPDVLASIPVSGEVIG